jgi:hypothetical protein
VDAILQLVRSHGAEAALSLVSLVVGGLIGRWRGWVGFARRAFFDRVTVSLNYVDGGQFRVRTLSERNAAEVFRNSEMLRAVMKAARRRGRNALLDLPDADYWYYLNAVLNTVSEQFAEGFVREEAGLEARSQEYLLFLTCEREGRVRQHKVRAMLIREALLLQTAQTKPQFKNEFQASRWETLGNVREEWVSSGGKSPRIRKIAICV